MSAIDNWNAPQWADFYASPMANIDDYFNTEHAELERRRTMGMDSLCGTISEELQESSPPDNAAEGEEGSSNDATLVETHDELVPPVDAPQNKANTPELVKEKKTENKNIKINQGRPRVLTSNVRRQSISRYRRRSDQYVPLAEALRKFQNGTPTRFRSNKSKEKDAAPLKKVKQTKTQLTYPMSPALRCKSRTRTVSTASQQSQPGLKPLAKSSSFPRTFPSALQKKTINQKPLRKIEKIPPASEPTVTMLPPKEIQAMLKETEKTLSAPSSSKDTSMLSSSIMSKSMRAHNTPRKKMAATVVATDEGMKIEKVEVLHFGIPVANANKKITRPKPFSFETRNKELQNKKVKLKTQQEEAEKTKKTTFHAKAAPASTVVKRPVSVLKPKENNVNKPNPTKPNENNVNKANPVKPNENNLNKANPLKHNENNVNKANPPKLHENNVNKPNPTKPNENNFNKQNLTKPNDNNVNKQNPPKPKENNVNKANPTTRTLSFKERNELALKKKKELMDQMYEKEKKARVFHAKPAPTFKPVFVRGNSAENLRAGDKNKAKTRGISPTARQRGQSQESLVSGNQENEAPSVTNQGCPKLKNPLMTEKQTNKRTTK